MPSMLSLPFFLTDGPQLGEGDGRSLSSLELPQDYWVVLVHQRGETKLSTAAVYTRFDERAGHGDGFVRIRGRPGRAGQGAGPRHVR